jgi:hypothetical protein
MDKLVILGDKMVILGDLMGILGRFDGDFIGISPTAKKGASFIGELASSVCTHRDVKPSSEEPVAKTRACLVLL